MKHTVNLTCQQYNERDDPYTRQVEQSNNDIVTWVSHWFRAVLPDKKKQRFNNAEAEEYTSGGGNGRVIHAKKDLLTPSIRLFVFR